MTIHIDSIAHGISLKGNSFPPIPQYLQTTYWWAYIHPCGVRIFERQWLVNLILWGNYGRLCDAVMHGYGKNLCGRTLQIACAYGNLTPRLSEIIGSDGGLEVIDILPIQLGNLARKLPKDSSVKLHCMDSTSLIFPDHHFERALLFFLLHEQPLDARTKTLAEAVRVIRPGGTLTIVDYAGPGWLNPLRYVMAPVLALLEPYARELWNEDVVSWLPKDADVSVSKKRRFFGGLYQIITLEIGSATAK